ncbi:nucleoside phosphatase GDA1/CD39 [Hesseltinella vesiculosa]|uniref:guanosine-diphosphatase n=1 Tax=Hesseltinella vesiculosa TaxID=101127 RepID=A0A1X2GK38_9FUNG|nr:nucleoside phosphatase GDA1/CD39 [Hesseltinella vesiculosa]
MIDAGSSGSRVHVYRFNFCKKEPQLEDEVFHMLKPGLSSYKDDPAAAAHSLDELMQIAVKNVPSEFHHCTPLAVKATAGLRLLGKDISDRILSKVRSHLETSYPFPIAGDDGVAIMDGSDEGVYAWITVNYLLGKLDPAKRGTSAAVFDLGGASTQVVFEPSKEMIQGEHKYTLNYGEGDPFVLYQHSYLGFGLNEARKHIKEAIVDLWKDQWSSSSPLYHPCLPLNHSETITTTKGQGNDETTMEFQLVGTGAGAAQCRAVLEPLFRKDECQTSPCAFNGVYQPSLTDAFSQRDLFVFSFFYDLTQPLGMPKEFSVAELGSLAQRVCDGQAEQYFRHVPDASILLQKPDLCLELTYLYSLLKTGYDLPSDRIVRTAQKIKGMETGWCLGASIAMIDAQPICKA